MEKNINEMTIEDLEELQKIISIEIDEKRKKQRANARNKIYKLIDEIGQLCEDNDLILCYPNEAYNGSIKVITNEFFLDD